MKFKRLFIVLLISFMLLSVPCAYAMEDTNLNSFAKGAIVVGDTVTNVNSPTDDKCSDMDEKFVVDEKLINDIAACEVRMAKINEFVKKNKDYMKNGTSLNIVWKNSIKAKAHIILAKKFIDLISSVNSKDKNKRESIILFAKSKNINPDIQSIGEYFSNSSRDAVSMAEKDLEECEKYSKDLEGSI